MTTDREQGTKSKKKDVEFIRPPNMLKAKVGSGGLSEEILERAQLLLESHSATFEPIAFNYMSNMFHGLLKARNSNDESDHEELIANLLYPSMQLKANGGMFNYPLVTTISDRLVHFLENVGKLDDDVIEIVMAFHTSLQAVLHGRITGEGGERGEELLAALDDACERYFKRTKNVYKRAQDDESDDF